VELSGEWPVPHNKVVISHFKVLSVAGQSWKLSFLLHCIENFIATEKPKHLLIRPYIQHEQLGWNYVEKIMFHTTKLLDMAITKHLLNR